MAIYEKYLEPLRRQFLHKFGFTAEMEPEQYVISYRGCPEEIEDELRDIGFSRNPVSWLKMHNVFGVSEGSWAKRDGYLSDMQLHVMLQRGTTEECITHIFAHWEANWFRHPIDHIFESSHSADEGIARTENLLRAHVDEDKLEYIEI